jgi:hypothetical protein
MYNNNNNNNNIQQKQQQIYSEQKSFVVICESEEARVDWMGAISKQCEQMAGGEPSAGVCVLLLLLLLLLLFVVCIHVKS